MFSKIMSWGEQVIKALLVIFSYFEFSLIQIFNLSGQTWLADAIEWVLDLLDKLPEVLTLFGDELIRFSFQTPLFELIVLSIPAYFAYQLIVWVLNIIT